jgi:hypothetical protein
MQCFRIPFSSRCKNDQKRHLCLHYRKKERGRDAGEQRSAMRNGMRGFGSPSHFGSPLHAHALGGSSPIREDRRQVAPVVQQSAYDFPPEVDVRWCLQNVFNRNVTQKSY